MTPILKAETTLSSMHFFTLMLSFRSIQSSSEHTQLTMDRQAVSLMLDSLYISILAKS